MTAGMISSARRSKASTTSSQSAGKARCFLGLSGWPSPVRQVQPPDIVRRDGADRVLEVACAQEREAELAADAVRAGIVRSRIGTDVAMCRDRLQAGQCRCCGGGAEAASAVRQQDFPADLVDRLAGFLARPVDDGADDLAVGGDPQYLDVARLVVGEVALVAVPELGLGLRAAEVPFLLGGVHGLEESKTALVPGQ